MFLLKYYFATAGEVLFSVVCDSVFVNFICNFFSNLNDVKENGSFQNIPEQRLPVGFWQMHDNDNKQEPLGRLGSRTLRPVNVLGLL